MGDETATLVDAVYSTDPQNHHLLNAAHIINNFGLWVFNQNFWTRNGVFVIRDRLGIGRGELVDLDFLQRLIEEGYEIKGVKFSKFGDVRFAPKETYSIERNIAAEKLSDDGFVIASYGAEGARLLARASSRFKMDTYVGGLDVRHELLSEKLEERLKRQRVSMIRVINHKSRSGDITPQLVLSGAHLDQYYSGGYTFPLAA